MKVQLKSNEMLVREGAANLQRGPETVGGRLYLTNQRLLFAPHRVNVQTAPTEIMISGIRAIRPAWTKFLGFLPVFPSSLAVGDDTQTWNFVLSDRREWAEAIDAQLSRPNA